MGECENGCQTNKYLGVFCYVPNIIGYIRVILLGLAVFTMREHCLLTIVLYTTSELLDALDGHAARYFNQTSQLGALLDMLTDRLSSVGLVIGICSMRPQLLTYLTMWTCLDIASHWSRMYSVVLEGILSHKSVENTPEGLLKFYYESHKVVMFFICAISELFLLCLYIGCFTNGPVVIGEVHVVEIAVMICLPVFLLKSFINVLQIKHAACSVAMKDAMRNQHND